MLLGIAIVGCLLSVPLAGGHLGGLADVRFRGGWLLLPAIAIQVFIVSIAPDGSHNGRAVAHVASYGLLACFAVLNRGFPYLWVIASGGALNLLAIAANGGVMPADPDALAGARLPATSTAFANSAAIDDPRLSFLGDVFWVPASFPASNVFSIGDVLLVLGAFLALHTVCGSRLALPRFGTLGRARRA